MKAAVVRPVLLAVAVTLAATTCSEAPTKPTLLTEQASVRSFVEAGASLDGWLGGYPDPSSPAPGRPILVGAGDIAECYQGNPPPPFVKPRDARSTAAEQTAQLLLRIPGTIMAIGDNAYQFGSLFDYQACYDPTWGRDDLFARTEPAAGNHEYMTAATGFFAYFGPKSRPPLGYYSYDLGSWHVIVLNSTPQVYMCYPPELTEIEGEVEEDPWWQALWPAPQLKREPRNRTLGRACAGDAAQQAWLVADLTANANKLCTAVYFHHPRFSSGAHGNHYQMQRVWDILYAYGADVVVTAHDHNYERFAPQDEDGRRDPTYGIRQFVVGTGGADLRSVGAPIRNSEVLFTGTHGVLALGLNEGSYGWAFVAVDGTIKDSGSTSCHGRPTKARLPFSLPS